MIQVRNVGYGQRWTYEARLIVDEKPLEPWHEISRAEVARYYRLGYVVHWNP